MLCCSCVQPLLVISLFSGLVSVWCVLCVVWWWLVVAVLPGTVLLERICLYWLVLARLACLPSCCCCWWLSPTELWGTTCSLPSNYRLGCKIDKAWLCRGVCVCIHQILQAEYITCGACDTNNLSTPMMCVARMYSELM